MAKIKIENFTVKELGKPGVMSLDDTFGSTWLEKIKSFENYTKNTNPSLMDMKGLSETNALELAGNYIRYCNSVIDSKFTNIKEEIIKPASQENKNKFDFLGFYGSPKIEEENKTVVRDALKTIIIGLSSISKAMNNNISKTAISSYLSNIKEIDTKDVTNLKADQSGNPLDVIFNLSNEGIISTNNYLGAILKISYPKDGARFRLEKYISHDKKLERLISIFNSNLKVPVLIETNVISFLNNEAVKEEFLRDSFKSFINAEDDVSVLKFLDKDKFPLNLIKNLKYSSISYFSLVIYCQMYFTIKYLEYYLTIGFKKLFPGESIKEVDKEVLNKADKNIKKSAIGGIPKQDKEKNKKFQADLWKAFGIIKGNPGFNEPIPDYLADGIIGTKTKKMMNDFIEMVKQNKVVLEKLKSEYKEGEFGEFGNEAIKYILENPVQFKEGIDVSNFLGLPDLELDYQFKKYIIKEIVDILIENNKEKLRVILYKKLENEFILNRKPTEEELKNAIDWAEGLRKTDWFKETYDVEDSNETGENLT